jgi:hypothetical protein
LAAHPETSADPSFSPEKIPKLAVIVLRSQTPRRAQTDSERCIEDAFVGVLMRKGYSVVSRSDLKSVLEEQRFQRSGLTERDAVAIGKILNVPAVMLVKVTDQAAAAMGARLIGVENAAVLWIGTFRQSRIVNSKSEDSAVLADVARRIALAFPPHKSATKSTETRTGPGKEDDDAPDNGPVKAEVEKQLSKAPEAVEVPSRSATTPITPVENALGHEAPSPGIAKPAAGRLSGGDDAPFPRPARDAIAKAEEKIREVYKGDVAKANKPSEKAALAGELMTAADGVGKDDASRLVLLTMARDLAVDADDAGLAMKAVSALAGRFQPDGPTNAKEQMERGNAPWKEAETAPAAKRLRLKVQAAEWYLRAKPAATGFDKTMIEKRLAEVQAADSPGRERVVMVSVWEHHWKPRNKEKQSRTLQLFSNGHTNSPDGRATWEKNGSTITFRFGGPYADICTLSKDGRSYDGHNTRDEHHVWGKLLSGEPMPK